MEICSMNPLIQLRRKKTATKRKFQFERIINFVIKGIIRFPMSKHENILSIKESVGDIKPELTSIEKKLKCALH